MTRIKLHVVSWQHSKSTTYLHINAKDYACLNYKKPLFYNTMYVNFVNPISPRRIKFKYVFHIKILQAGNKKCRNKDYFSVAYKINKA